ncbi:uncharacterized protein LOC124639233 [Helicoverpa zea]|uniref:uncharacterized protein LOC124630453 n=1 Tax=Helicoverpa zea TaxID=7113 RepID=UPI001F5624B1|nr:uncharacterized protein LOC124630453 [Helicoverpa zea]XP_047021200.1 uncharacterized protein LOC124631081 [Helicoverpa zea]XP_047028515.1 uncharacterized protein LOC124636463 [Helicoverpa zea]XP_047030152.1 uncharacterized protein LOC124637604 [Helicoverpa zea]XP_047032462.1 uncharacterized protein LOC124639233 [Helicoverpa zea]
MESSPSLVTNKFARKRKRDPENWSRNQAKILRYTPISMPEKVCNHNSKALKCDTLTMSQMKKLVIKINKLSDLKKLLCKHFGAEWKEIPTLSYYCNIFDEQESLDASTIPPSDYCDEALEEVPDLRI